MVSIKIRKIIYKIPVLHKILQKIVIINNKAWFIFANINGKFTTRLKQLKGIKKGKVCFIIGNGPSLLCKDLEKIKNYDSFGSNKIYKIFDKTYWKPTYYLAQDPYGASGKDINLIESSDIFIGDYYWRKHKIMNKTAICFHTIRNLTKSKIKFSENIEKYVSDGWTVTYTAIQFAVYMGYNKIYLLGMDHNYPNVLNAYGEVTEMQNSDSHFYKDEKPNEIVGNISGATKAYETAREYCDTHGIKIYNATRGGKLEVFERVDFDNLFEKNTETEI